MDPKTAWFRTYSFTRVISILPSRTHLKQEILRVAVLVRWSHFSNRFPTSEREINRFFLVTSAIYVQLLFIGHRLNCWSSRLREPRNNNKQTQSSSSCPGQLVNQPGRRSVHRWTDRWYFLSLFESYFIQTTTVSRWQCHRHSLHRWRHVNVLDHRMSLKVTVIINQR